MKIKKILFYGILWGMLEFVLGGYLHFIRHPFNEMIMMIIGYTILGICAFKNKYSFSLLSIGIIAASFKILNIFTCNLPLSSPGIINPIISILLHATIATIISFLIIKINSLFKQKNMNLEESIITKN